MADWETTLKTSYEQLIAYLVAYVPQLLGALILLLIGWFIAWLLAKTTTSLVSFTTKFLNKISHVVLPDKQLDIKPQHGRFAGKAVFWIVMLFFFAAATANLGMDFIATWLREFLGYLPNIFAGMVILLGGYFIGSIASTMTIAAADSTGFAHGQRLGLVVRWIIIFISIVIGIEQLGINIQFMTTLVIVQLGVLSSGVALAYGLGSSELVKNLVGARQAMKHLNVGDSIQIGDISGKIMQISQSMLVLETSSGKTLIPARLCMETSCQVIHQELSGAAEENPADLASKAKP